MNPVSLEMLSLHSSKRILRFRELKSLVDVIDSSRRARAHSKQQWKRYNIMSQHVWFKSYFCICGHEEIFITSPDLRGGLSSVQSLGHVWLFVTPWTTAHQASLSINNSRSLLKLMSIEFVMPSNHLILCHSLLLLLQSFPASRAFPVSQFFTSGGQRIGTSASVLPMNIQDWFPLGLRVCFWTLKYLRDRAWR